MVCVFCEISKGRLYAEVIYQNRHFFSIPDSNPQAEGHSLVVSKKHFDGFLDLKEDLGAALIDCIQNTATILIRKFNSPGFTFTSKNPNDLEQHINHFHIHILPQKQNSFTIGSF